MCGSAALGAEREEFFFFFCCLRWAAYCTLLLLPSLLYTLKLAATAVLRGATYQLGSGVNNSEDRSLLLGFDLSNVLT